MLVLTHPHVDLVFIFRFNQVLIIMRVIVSIVFHPPALTRQCKDRHTFRWLVEEKRLNTIENYVQKRKRNRNATVEFRLNAT